jgi:flagellar biosynthetic protein FliR
MVISVAQTQIFFLILTRVMALIIFVPNLGGQTIPNQVRIALGLLLACLMIPEVSLAPDAQSMGLVAFSIEIIKELAIGLILGFTVILTFSAVQIAGETMGLSSGFGSSRIFNPSIGETGSPIDQLFVVVGMLIFMAIDGHHATLLVLNRTFDLIPITSTFPAWDLNTVITNFSTLILYGIQLALPVLGVLLLTDIVLALLARVAPQIQVYFLGLPLKLGVSLIAVFLAFSLSTPKLINLFRNIAPKMLELVGNHGG